MGQKAITWDKTRLGDRGVLVGSVTLDDTDPGTEEFAALDGDAVSKGRWIAAYAVPDGAATQFTTVAWQVRSALDATTGIPIAASASFVLVPTLGSSSTARPGFVYLAQFAVPALMLLCSGGTGTKAQAFKIYLVR